MPAALNGRMESAGNTALSGTLLLATQPETFARMQTLSQCITRVELVREGGFQDACADTMLDHA